MLGQHSHSMRRHYNICNILTQCSLGADFARGPSLWDQFGMELSWLGTYFARGRDIQLLSF